ncbi:hypothetical protein [Rhizobium leguminosarum]|uniref:hypothetical protein n=1 Tax=Rhizobium leguminosarum TaxID=384 RepID=UPI00103D52C0|nr:hypothetical protein [Rhizobium leguminosarum]TBY41616.1 hypothetical protein E0H54_30985 [Rhizobium leguminosarum bv. viciae]
MDGQLEGYLIALKGATHYALDVTVNRIIRGEIDGLSKKFCPTAPELSSVIRDEMQAVQRQIDLAAERRMIQDNRQVAVEPKLFEDRIAGAKARMMDEGRKYLFAAESFSSARKSDLRPGSTYVGILGAWYGPPGSLHEPEPEPEPMPEPSLEELVAEIDPPAPEPGFQDVEF